MGFSIPEKVYRSKPQNEVYLKTTVKYKHYKNTRLTLNYPFTRLYMNENKAQEAENAYRESNRRSINKTTYGAVRIYNGTAALENVYIDGITLREAAEQRLEEQSTLEEF